MFLFRYTVKDLKELLTCRGLKISGVKEELIQRLQAFEEGLNKMVSITITDLEVDESSDEGEEVLVAVPELSMTAGIDQQILHSNAPCLSVAGSQNEKPVEVSVIEKPR